MQNKMTIDVIDLFLLELGTSTIIDARKARDQLLDMRLMCMLEMDLEQLEPVIPVLN